MSGLRRHWRDPHFYRWWWNTNAGRNLKAALTLTAVLLLFGTGFLGAHHLIEAEPVYTEQMITVTRTHIVRGRPQLVTEIRRIRVKVKPDVRTVIRDGQTIRLTTPAETIVATRTIKGPVRKSVVFKNRTRLVKVAGPKRTITLPGTTLPGTTIAGPERVVTVNGPAVTAPAETIDRIQTVERVTTVTGPTQTVTGPTETVTGPTVTVTGPTVTVTETETVTVTSGGEE